MVPLFCILRPITHDSVSESIICCEWATVKGIRAIWQCAYKEALSEFSQNGIITFHPNEQKKMKKQNKSLADVESAIIALVGDDIDSYNLHRLSSGEIETIEELLAERKHILNEMFQPTDENMARFRAINQRLLELTENLHRRFKIIESKSAIFSDCPDFDDDYEIEGWLHYIFDGPESVLSLPDDCYYGSMFALMIKTLYELYEEKWIQNIESVYHESAPLDDGVSWDEPPYRGKPEFDDIVICHAVHDLTNHKAYSIPDLLRLNDFWCEVQIKIQSITDQKGNRWNYEKQE